MSELQKPDERDFNDRLSDSLKNAPPMSETARQFLREDPVGYSVSRSRLVKAAIRDWDEDLIFKIVGEIKHLVGEGRAAIWFIYKWNEVLEESRQQIEQN